jgi:SAM-dependent methyltransferase
VVVQDTEISAALSDGWLAPGQRVLDLGCGLGEEIAMLAERGVYAVAIDVSAEHKTNGVRFIQGDVLHLPFATHSFDALLDRGCFAYVPEPARAAYADELARVLRPGGHLLLNAPIDQRALRHWFNGWELPREREPHVFYLEHPAA